MSNLSAALAAALQNDSTVSALITGVIAGRNFDLQDEMLESSPYACIGIRDLVYHEDPYLATSTSGDVISGGQIELQCVSKASEVTAQDLALTVRAYLWSHPTLPWNGGTLSFRISEIFQNSDISEDLKTWIEILTVGYT